MGRCLEILNISSDLDSQFYTTQCVPFYEWHFFVLITSLEWRWKSVPNIVYNLRIGWLIDHKWNNVRSISYCNRLVSWGKLLISSTLNIRVDCCWNHISHIWVALRKKTYIFTRAWRKSNFFRQFKTWKCSFIIIPCRLFMTAKSFKELEGVWWSPWKIMSHKFHLSENLCHLP